MILERIPKLFTEQVLNLNLVTVKGFLSPSGKKCNNTTDILLDAKRREAPRETQTEMCTEKEISTIETSEQSGQAKTEAGSSHAHVQCHVHAYIIHTHSTYIRIIGEPEMHGRVYPN